MSIVEIINNGFLVSLGYGLMLLSLLGIMMWTATYANRIRWIGVIYDYSGIVMVLAPVLILIWHVSMMMEEKREQKRAAAEVPVVRERDAPVIALPTGERIRVLPATAGSNTAGGPQAGRVPSAPAD